MRKRQIIKRMAAALLAALVCCSTMFDTPIISKSIQSIVVAEAADPEAVDIDLTVADIQSAISTSGASRVIFCKTPAEKPADAQAVLGEAYWAETVDEVTTLYVVPEEGGKLYAPENCKNLFQDMDALTEIDLAGLDTSKVTSMSYMFAYCDNLEKVNVSELNTSNVRTMDWMFVRCWKLTQLDVSKWDTSKVEDMGFLFECIPATELDVSNWNTSNVKRMFGMFRWSSITSLDVSKWDTSNVENLQDFLLGCYGLTSVDLSSFRTPKLKTMNLMIADCNIVNLDIRNFDTSNVTDTRWISTFKNFTVYCNNPEEKERIIANSNADKLTCIVVNIPISIRSDEHSTITVTLEDGTEVQDGDLVEIGTVLHVAASAEAGYQIDSQPDETVIMEEGLDLAVTSVESYDIDLMTADIQNAIRTSEASRVIFCKSADEKPAGAQAVLGETYWSETVDEVTTLYVVPKEDGILYAPENCKNLFRDMDALTEIDLAGLDTSKVTSMSYMFAYCDNLEKVNVSELNTSNVKTMDWMFVRCWKLTQLDVSKWDTSKVEDMGFLFECIPATELDVSNWNTSNVKRMFGMFRWSSITSLDVSKWDTSNVENLQDFLLGCYGLTSVDLSSFRTPKLKNMNLMIADCNIVNLDIRNFDTSNVTDIRWISTFKDFTVYCNNLEEKERIIANSNASRMTCIVVNVPISIQADEHSTITVTLEDGTAVQDGDILEIGTVLHVTAAADTGYTLKSQPKNTVRVEENLTLAAVSVKNKVFTDVDEASPYFETIQDAVAKGIMKGKGQNSTEFAPEELMTRAMVVTVLYRLAGKPEVVYEKTFSDVKAGKYYVLPVTWAVKNKIVSGHSDGNFRPNTNVTMEQMVVMLYRFGESLGMNMSADGDLEQFSDRNQVASYARTAYKWAIANGIVKENSENRLNPKKVITRAEAADYLLDFSKRM